MMYRPQRGGLAESMAEKTFVLDFADLCTVLNASEESVKLRPYGYDVRNDWQTYAVLINNQIVEFTNGAL